MLRKTILPSGAGVEGGGVDVPALVWRKEGGEKIPTREGKKKIIPSRVEANVTSHVHILRTCDVHKWRLAALC